MAAVHALLVGINEYHPASKVSGLHGCINDVDVMQEYIKKSFSSEPQTNIILLKNEAATRTNVVETFKRHLCNNTIIRSGDTVLFYYSGHGSYAPSAKEFTALNEDSKQQDETLVLYDSRVNGNFDLADKELALLLSQIPTQANIVVVLDSCHSGSATRNVSRADEIKLGLPRFTSKSEAPRELADYIEVNGVSYKKLHEQGKLEIPKSKHILLAACGRDELAYESPSARGLFSTWLIDLLEDAPADATYARLHENLYTVIKRRANKQTPQLKAYEAFDTNLLFLKNEASSGKALHKVVFKGTDWVINYGALNGLPPDKDVINNCLVQLYAGNEPKPMHTVSIKKVGLNESILKMPGNTDTKAQFTADVINLPPTLVIYVEGEKAEKDEFFLLLEKSRQYLPLLHFHQNAAAYYDLIVDLHDKQVVIREAETRQLIHGVKKLQKGTVDYAVNALLQMAKWKNMERLQNCQSNIPETDMEFVLQLKDETGSWVDSEGSNITLDLTKEKPEIPFRIRLLNVSETPYYIALYRLASTFAIEKHSKDVDASLLKKGDVPSIECNAPDEEEPCSFVIEEENINEETEIYKLVYSTDIFYDYFVEESNELKREIIDAAKPKGIRGIKKSSRSDWGAKTISIRLVRELQQVNATQGYTNNVISIKPHASFKAAVSLTPIDSAAKSYNPAGSLKEIFSGDEFSLLNLNEKSKGDMVPQQSVVELSDIGNEEILDTEPLEINLNYTLAEDEQVMAVTYSDGLVIPIGLLEKSADSDSHVMKLHQAPAQTDPARAAGKNPVRALWFCFLKVVLKREDEVFKLRYIDYKDGASYYPKEAVDEKIEQSSKVLLVIHGIIGNTKSIAANMEFFLREGKYDCVLSFDYENLNTSISGIAAQLKERLEKNGISEQKKIDIIAHSMGGLVSRYMIEKLGGDKLVSRLFLVGTPNNGSSFGKLVTMRKWATGILTLVCNYGKQFLGTFGFFLEGVNKVLAATKPITNTLEEMGSGSDFLKELNENTEPVTTKYFVLAGNTTQYLLTEQSTVKKLMEKVKLAIGKLAYWDVDNDIAVSVDSIRKLPEGRVEKEIEIGCHHLNYFEYDVSVKTLRELMG